jgi:hypothetical protein
MRLLPALARASLLASVSLVSAACAASSPPAAAPSEAASAGPEPACDGTTCDACLAEPGCVFQRASGLCLTREEAAYCSGDACASAASECSAGK